MTDELKTKTIVKANARSEKFAHEYVIDLNGRRAAIASGFSPRGAAVAAVRMLKKGNVRRLIDQLKAERASKLSIKGEMVIEELKKLAFSNIRDYTRVNNGGQLDVDLSNLTREQAAAIQEFTVDTHGTYDGERGAVLRTKLKLADKQRALELLGKHLKLFSDHVVVAGDEQLVAALAAGRKRLLARAYPDSTSPNR
jgi:phage terminase small subunit